MGKHKLDQTDYSNVGETNTSWMDQIDYLKVGKSDGQSEGKCASLSTTEVCKKIIIRQTVNGHDNKAFSITNDI